ncbi:MAG: M28 family peptidase [Lachnotalea sp.]
MKSIIKNIKIQCQSKSRALGKKGNYEFVKQLKQYLEEHGVLYTAEEYKYKYFKTLEGSITVDGIEYFSKTFVGAPPFFNYEYYGKYMLDRRGSFHISDAPDIYVEKLEQRDKLIENLESILERKEIQAIIFVIPGSTDNILIDIVVSMSNPKANRIKNFRRIPIIAISEVTWNVIREAKVNRVEIKQKCVIDSATHENVIVNIGKGECQIYLCAHIDSAFEREDIEGAHDNASGVAIMMQLVVELSKIKELHKRVKFIFYNGEEYNMIGCFNLLIDMKKFNESHNYEDLFYMFHNGELKDYIILKAEEMVEFDVIGKGKVLHIFTNEDLHDMKELLQSIKTDEIEKVLLHNGGASLYYILSKLDCNMKFHFSQLSNMINVIHTVNDNMENIDEKDIRIYYNFIDNYIKKKL